MNPLSPPQHIIDLAVEVSGWSPCRSKRGVVLHENGDVIAHGYNYKPRGFDCDGTEACKSTCRIEAVHAEQQALLTAGKKAEGAELVHVKTVNGALVASGEPSCIECSKLARACSVRGVWLFHESGWRRYPMLEFHRLSLRGARPSPPPADGSAKTDERGWVLEGKLSGGEIVYWDGRTRDSESLKHEDAVRFARREDAEKIRLTQTFKPDYWTSVQHLWFTPAVSPPPATPQEKV